MKTLLILNQHQFGYLTDSYAWCKYLSREWHITYVGWDHDAKKVKMEGVTVEYVSRRGSKPFRLARYIRTAIASLRRQDYDAVLIVYFAGASCFLPWVARRRTMIDVRTGSDRPGWFRREFENALLRFECLLFRERSIVSKSLQNFLSLGRMRFLVLPLGGENVSLPPKIFDALHLFYVGTLEYRSIHETVLGLDRWWTTRRPRFAVSYDIVGSGRDEEEALLRAAIERSPLRDSIRFHGRLPNAEIFPFLRDCNVGVAYVPQTDFYDCQPSTKVFEYLLAGMPVIATNTTENVRVINAGNGAVIEDTIEGFSEGLEQISSRLTDFDSRAITEASQQYSWEEIVKNVLAPKLNALAGAGAHDGVALHEPGIVNR